MVPALRVPNVRRVGPCAGDDSQRLLPGPDRRSHIDYVVAEAVRVEPYVRDDS